MTLRLDSQRGLSIVLAVYVALGVIYSLASPIFEKPDEPAHFAYIQSLADGRGFPAAPVVIADASPSQESSQPPLYYLAAALAVRLLAPDTADFARLLVHNPAFPVVNSDVPIDNRNVFVHATPEMFPYTGAARAVQVARLVALAFGALTVWATYRLGREAFPDRAEVALLAASMAAFTPQFIFISSAVNNDSAAAASCALALWSTARIMRSGFTLRRISALGLALGLAAISKASALALWPLALIAILAVKSVLPGLMERLRWAALAVGVGLVVAAPWYLHALAQFNDLLGTSLHFAMPWARAQPLSLVQTLNQAPGAWQSYWLAFGWGNILAPDAVYGLLNGVTVVGALGLGIWLWQTRRRIEGPIGWLLIAWLALIIVALLNWVRWLDAALGRLIFPAMASLALLLSAGWHTLVYRLGRGRSARVIAALPGAILLVLSIVALPLWIVPAYAPPALLTDEDLNRQPGQAIDVVYGQVARLVRWDAPRDPWPQPGGRLNLRLCWEPLQRDARLLLVLVQIVGPQNRVVASRRTVPGLGTYPTGSWTPGQRFCDPVQVQIDAQAPVPAVYWVEVSIIDPQTDTRLPAYSAEGTLLATNFVGQVKLAPDRYALPAIEHALDQRLGDQFELIGCDLEPAIVAPGDTAVLRLYWRALRRPDRAYTVFVHVTDRTGHPLTNADSPPQSGLYPTPFWDAGEVVIDEHPITIPPLARAATYPLSVGMYTPDDGARLPVSGGISPTEIQLPLDLEVGN